MAESITSLRLKVDSTDVVTAQRNLNNLGTESKKLETGIASLSAKLIGGALAFGSISAAASSFISTAGKFEQYAVSLKVLSGSAAAAEKSFAWVKDFTAKTPYTLDETMEAFIRLKAYGIDATNGSLKTLGDTAAAMGKPLMAAVEAMADAMVGENERLKEFGIRASKEGDTIAYKWMDSSGKAKQQIIQNNGEIIKSTLEAIFNEKYAGMMDEQSKTWVGAVSNLEDTWTSFKDSLARDSGIFEAAKETVKGLNEALNGQNETLNTLLPIVASLGVTYGVMKTASIGAALTETALEAIRSKSIVTTTAYNAALMRNVTTTTTLTAAQTASAVASSAMGTAMKAVPFLAVAGVVSSLAMAFFDAKNNSDELRNSLDQTAESLAKLTKNQLEFREASIAQNIMDKGLELRQAKQKAQVQGIFQSDLAYKEELANLDMLKQEYKGLMTAGQQVRDFKSGKLKPVEETKTKAEVTTTATELTKAQIAAQKKSAKEAEKLRQEEADIQRGYLESYAEIQANNAIEEYNVKLGYEEAYRDFAAKEAIEQYELELTMLNDLADRQAQSAIAFYEMTRTEKDKINEENLALYEANAGLFNDEQMQTFFTKWQESIEGVKGGYNDIQGIVSSFVEDSLNSKDWTAGLTGTAKSVANLGNAFKDLDKQNKKYETARKKVAKSSLNDEEKSIANKEIENAQYYAQIDAYGALAGAAAGFFEQGSSMAKAMAVVQGGLAIVSAGAGGDPITVIPRMIAAAAMVAQTLSQSGISSGGGSKAPDYSQTIKEASFASGKGVSIGDYRGNFDKFIEGLDSATKKLEDFGSVGSSLSERLTTLTNTLNSYQEIVDRWTKLVNQGVTVTFLDPQIKQVKDEISAILTEAVQESLDYSTMSVSKIGELVGSIDLVAYNNTLAQINDLALKAKQAGGILSEADKQTLIELYTLPNYIKAQDYEDALEIFKEFTEKSVENIKSFNDSFKTDEQLLNDLHAELGRGSIAKTIPQLMDLFDTLKQGVDGLTDSELEFLEANKALIESNIEIKTSLFDNIQSFVDGLKDSIIAKDTATTFNTFSSSFNSMIDAIIDGSDNMGEAGSLAINNARSYLDTVSATATSARDISFAKAVIANRFSDIVATPDTSLNTINSTLNSNNAQLIAELQSLKFELQSLKQLNITQTATQIKTLSTQRAVLGEMVS